MGSREFGVALAADRDGLRDALGEQVGKVFVTAGGGATESDRQRRREPDAERQGHDDGQ